MIIKIFKFFLSMKNFKQMRGSFLKTEEKRKIEKGEKKKLNKIVKRALMDNYLTVAFNTP